MEVHPVLIHLPGLVHQDVAFQAVQADHINLEDQDLLMVPALVEQAFQHEQKTDIPNFMTDVQDLGSLHIVELLRKN